MLPVELLLEELPAELLDPVELEPPDEPSLELVDEELLDDELELEELGAAVSRLSCLSVQSGSF